MDWIIQTLAIECTTKMIRKKVAQVTGNSEGVTFTKPEKEILGDLKLGDIIEIKKVEKDE